MFEAQRYYYNISSGTSQHLFQFLFAVVSRSLRTCINILQNVIRNQAFFEKNLSRNFSPSITKSNIPAMTTIPPTNLGYR